MIRILAKNYEKMMGYELVVKFCMTVLFRECKKYNKRWTVQFIGSVYVKVLHSRNSISVVFLMDLLLSVVSDVECRWNKNSYRLSVLVHRYGNLVLSGRVVNKAVLL